LNPAPSPRYAFSWAVSVVNQLHSKYARATEKVCAILEITCSDLAKYLAFDDPLWRYLRDTIKKLDGNLAYYGERYTTAHLLSVFQGPLAKKRFGNQAERLDKRLKSLSIKEQGSRLGADRSVSEGKPLPSSPDIDAYGRRWVQGAFWP